MRGSNSRSGAASAGDFAAISSTSPAPFADANAFYSNELSAALRYFPAEGHRFLCLSHDVVAHETTHALVDGLRERFTDPSSPDQAAFTKGSRTSSHALGISLGDVTRRLLDRQGTKPAGTRADRRSIGRAQLTAKALRQSLLFGLAEEMGSELSLVRGQALRRSVDMPPSRAYIRSREFDEPHRRGELLVAAIMNAFIGVLVNRLQALGHRQGHAADRSRVAEEAAESADYLLTMTIRALDYTPPVHVEFTDFLSALLTADHEIRPDDSKYHFRKHLLASFRSYGIDPCPEATKPDGFWPSPPVDMFRRDRTHFESMTRDPDEVFRFIWENRRALGLSDGGTQRVLTSGRSAHRADVVSARETVANASQIKVEEAG